MATYTLWSVWYPVVKVTHHARCIKKSWIFLQYLGKWLPWIFTDPLCPLDSCLLHTYEVSVEIGVMLCFSHSTMLWHSSNDTSDSKEVINSSFINKMTVNHLKPTKERQKNDLRCKVAEINVFLGVPISHASGTCLSQWLRLAFRSLSSIYPVAVWRPLPGVYHASCMVKTAKHSALQHKLLNSNCLLSKTLWMASIIFYK